MRVGERYVVRPVNGLIPVDHWTYPPGRHPKAFVLFQEEELKTWPLFDPDDLVDWVPLRDVERSAGEVIRKRREDALARRLFSPEGQAEQRLRTDLGSRRINLESDHGRATKAYAGSDAALTRRTLRELEDKGQFGRIAAALFRAQKSSSRAKRYRGGPDRGSASYSDLAYDRKGETLRSLCKTLAEDDAGIRWGWGLDDNTEFAPHVLYVDIPTGQVSFHSLDRFDGPDYPGSWDGVKDVSAARILLWCDRMLGSSGDGGQ